MSDLESEGEGGGEGGGNMFDDDLMDHTNDPNAPPGKKRANHNELERKRRQSQKQRLLELRQAIPSIRQERPSAIQILAAAKDYIDHLNARASALHAELSGLAASGTFGANLPPPQPPPHLPVKTTRLGRPTKASKAEENAELERYVAHNALLRARLKELARRTGSSVPLPLSVKMEGAEGAMDAAASGGAGGGEGGAGAHASGIPGIEVHAHPSPGSNVFSPFLKSVSPLPSHVQSEDHHPYSEEQFPQDEGDEGGGRAEGGGGEGGGEGESDNGFNPLRRMSSEDFDSPFPNFPVPPSHLPSLPQPGFAADSIMLPFQSQAPASPLPSPSNSPKSPSPIQIQIPSTKTIPKFDERQGPDPTSAINFEKRKSRADNDFELARKEYYQRRNSTVEDMRDHQQRINEVGLLQNFAVQARRASLPSAFLDGFQQEED